jgi:xanthine dehydrogenase iron-sulfur cluster and FAD-binding subunit A
MTATQQPANPVTRWAKTVIRSVRDFYGELTAAGEVQARLNRFRQPRPQADLAQAKQAHPAGKVLAGA